MDSNTGRTYESVDDALKAGVKREDVVEVRGTPKAVKRVVKATRTYNFLKAKKRRRLQRASRRANR